jgi:integrase
MLGPVSELKTKKDAQRAFEPFLARVNSADCRPGKFTKIGEFADVWEREVLQHQKPSSIKAVHSHLRTYIRPWLAQTRIEEFTGEAQQIFVTRLAQRVSRKSVQNIMGTLASTLKSAKAWGYVVHAVNMADLTLPSEAIPPSPRCFTAEELRRIVAVAPDACRTMFAIAGMTGLRVGEVVGLQHNDLDFDRLLVHVRRSAWYGRVQTVKSKASRAPVVMLAALAAMLESYFATWKPNPEDSSS